VVEILQHQQGTQVVAVVVAKSDLAGYLSLMM
jgi:hypothetical protein